MIKIIYIDNEILEYNKNNNTRIPIYRIEDGTIIRYCMEVYIHGYSKMVYRPDTPRKCGATYWLETDSPVILVDEITYNDIKDSMKSK